MWVELENQDVDIKYYYTDKSVQSLSRHTDVHVSSISIARLRIEGQEGLNETESDKRKPDSVLILAP
jgi:hypothetical protein